MKKMLYVSSITERRTEKWEILYIASLKAARLVFINRQANVHHRIVLLRMLLGRLLSRAR